MSVLREIVCHFPVQKTRKMVVYVEDPIKPKGLEFSCSNYTHKSVDNTETTRGGGGGG